MNKKKILILGGAGFIGHNLSIYLKNKKFNILCVDNLEINNFHYVKNNIKDLIKKKLYTNFLNERIDLLKKNKINLINCDIKNFNKIKKIFDKFRPDVVVHLAAVSHDNRSNINPRETFENSYVTLFNSLDSSKNFSDKIHFIYFSSSMVYGNFKKRIVTENENCNPIGVYGSLKLSGELLIKSFSNVFGINYSIIRPSALYGERCISNRVIQIFFERAFFNQKINIMGDGKEKLDFTYIGDLCDGVYKIIKNLRNSKNQTFNLTYGSSRSINTIKKFVKSKFKNQKFEHLKRNKLVAIRGTLSVNKAKKLVGYKPIYNIKKGIQKYYEWYEKKFADLSK